MYSHILTAVSRELSGARALRRVGEVSRYHRIQSSPGFRDSAAYCARQLEAAGLEVEVLSFPGDGKTRFWGSVAPEEWDCRDADLRLLTPETESRLLASFADNPISIVQRSHGTPPGGITAELVAVDGGDSPGAYDGIDVDGKIVLAAGDLARVRQLAVEERGALGIVTDHLTEAPPVRPAMEIPDARQYSSFWWAGHEKGCFGFVVSPREGARLRKLCRDAASGDGTAPTVRARVDASFYPGEMEVVSAVLPGTGEEEVWVVAHLCHPQPSANDNASGAGAALEVARVLAALRGSQELPVPARSIRFLLVPEMTGTYAFLAANEDLIGRCVAAVNLDMVGQNQDMCGSTLQVECPPLSQPSFTGDLMAEILGSIASDAKNLAGTARFSTFRWAVTPFSGGSDHYILSDPTVGIPCPMLIQWPDRFYHTDHDTMDKVDPAMLAVVGRLTATYAHFLAAAGKGEAEWLAGRIVSRFGLRLSGALARATEGDWLLARRLEFLRDRSCEDLGAVKRLAGAGEVDGVIDASRADLDRLLDVYRGIARREAGEDGGEPVGAGERSAVVPRRLVRGPISIHSFLHLVPADLLGRWEEMSRERKAGPTMLIHALYWMDGRRTVGEIADLVELETGLRDVELLELAMEVLKALGFLAAD